MGNWDVIEEKPFKPITPIKDPSGSSNPWDVVEESPIKLQQPSPVPVTPIKESRVQIPQMTSAVQRTDQEESWPKLIGKSVMGGLGSIGTGIIDESKALAENAGIDVGEWTDTLSKDVADFWTPKVGDSTAKKYAAAIAQSTATSLPLMLTGPAALPLFAITSGGNKYRQMREAGQSPGTSLAGSQIVGASEALTEIPTMKAIFNPATKTILKRAANVIWRELPGEEVNTAIEDIVDKLTIRPDMTFKDYLKDAFDTAVTTIGQTGLTAGIMHPLVKQAEKQQQEQQGQGQPIQEITEPPRQEGVPSPMPKINLTAKTPTSETPVTEAKPIEPMPKIDLTKTAGQRQKEAEAKAVPEPPVEEPQASVMPVVQTPAAETIPEEPLTMAELGALKVKRDRLKAELESMESGEVIAPEDKGKYAQYRYSETEKQDAVQGKQFRAVNARDVEKAIANKNPKDLPDSYTTNDKRDAFEIAGRREESGEEQYIIHFKKGVAEKRNAEPIGKSVYTKADWLKSDEGYKLEDIEKITDLQGNEISLDAFSKSGTETIKEKVTNVLHGLIPSETSTGHPKRQAVIAERLGVTPADIEASAKRITEQGGAIEDIDRQLISLIVEGGHLEGKGDKTLPSVGKVDLAPLYDKQGRIMDFKQFRQSQRELFGDKYEVAFEPIVEEYYGKLTQEAQRQGIKTEPSEMAAAAPFNIDTPIVDIKNLYGDRTSEIDTIRQRAEPQIAELKKQLKGKRGEAKEAIQNKIDELVLSYEAPMMELDQEWEDKSEQLSNTVTDILKKKGITDEGQVNNIVEYVLNAASDTSYLEGMDNWQSVTPRNILDSILKQEGLTEQKAQTPVPEPSEMAASAPEAKEGMAYNPKREIFDSKNNFTASIKKRGFHVESKNIIGKSEDGYVYELIYNDGKRKKFAYGLIESIGDSEFETVVVSLKKIEKEQIGGIFNEGEKAHNEIIAKEPDPYHNPKRLAFWNVKIADEWGEQGRKFDIDELREEAERRHREFLAKPEPVKTEKGKTVRQGKPIHQVKFDPARHSLFTWIRIKGGIDYNRESMKGELDKLAESNKFIINKKGEGLTLDYLREAAVEDGFIGADASLSDFVELLDTEARGTKVFSSAGAEARLEKDLARRDAEQAKINRNQIEVMESDLDDGANVYINKEKYTVKRNDDGTVSLIDGELIKLDHFDRIHIDKDAKGNPKIERGKKKVTVADLKPQNKVTDFSKDAEWNDIAYMDATKESLSKLKTWIKDNPYATVRMYHGTDAKIPILQEGLKPTSAKTRKSLQARGGVVSLSIYPGMAKAFGEMAYPQKKIAVYAVDVPVNRLVPDGDQLRNKRLWGQDKNIGATLADSIAYGHGAQIKGAVPIEWIKQIETEKPFTLSTQEGRTVEGTTPQPTKGLFDKETAASKMNESEVKAQSAGKGTSKLEGQETLPEGVLASVVNRLKNEVSTAKEIAEREQATMDRLHASDNIPGVLQAGGSNYKLGKRREAMNNRLLNQFTKLQTAKTTLKEAEQRLEGYQSGERHENGQPRANAPSRVEKAKAVTLYSDFIRDTVKPGDKVTFLPNPLKEGTIVKRLNPKTITLDSGTTWSYDNIQPWINGKEANTKAVREAYKTWKASKEQGQLAKQGAEPKPESRNISSFKTGDIVTIETGEQVEIIRQGAGSTTVRGTKTTPIEIKGKTINKRPANKSISQETWASRGQGISLQTEGTERKPFYSQLRKVISEQMPNIVTPTVFNRIISQNREGIRGIKPEEIADAKATVNAIFGDKKAMPKQEILDYLEAVDRTDVQDVVLGYLPTKEKEIGELKADIYDLEVEIKRHLKDKDVSREEIGKLTDTFLEKTAKLKKVESRFYDQQYKDEREFTHFSQYQMEGDKVEGSYREQFVTAPHAIGGAPFETFKEYQENYPTGTKAEYEAFKQGYTEEQLSWQDGHSKYSDIKNPIVRIRYNDRIDADGNLVRFIEELQKPSKENEAKMPEIYRKYAYQIGLKRMLQGIAEENVQREAEGKPLITRLAWTPGSVQADRYDLSKQISKVTFEDNSSGGIANADMEGPIKKGVLKAYDLNGKKVIEDFIDEPSEIEIYIGKEAAKKLIEASPTAERFAGIGVRRRTISGLDLKVGGEGLKRLYDVTIPKFLERYGEAWGAKVEDVQIKVTDFSIGKGSPNEKGQSFYFVYKGNDPSPFGGRFTTRQEAKKFMLKQNSIGTVPSITITPEMQSSILHEGQPLFQTGKPSFNITPDQIQDVMSDALRIAAEGSKVEIKDKITIDPDQMRQALQAWNSGDMPKTVTIKGLHRQIRLNGNQTISLMQFSLSNMDMTTPYHEAFHSVQELLLNDNELKVLERAYPATGKLSTKEKQAEAFGKYAAELKTGKKAFIPNSAVRQIFKKIADFFEKLRNSLHSLGFQNAEDIFGKAFRGEYRERGIERKQGTDISYSMSSDKGAGDKPPVKSPQPEGGKKINSIPSEDQFYSWHEESEKGYIALGPEGIRRSGRYFTGILNPDKDIEIVNMHGGYFYDALIHNPEKYNLTPNTQGGKLYRVSDKEQFEKLPKDLKGKIIKAREKAKEIYKLRETGQDIPDEILNKYWKPIDEHNERIRDQIKSEYDKLTFKSDIDLTKIDDRVIGYNDSAETDLISELEKRGYEIIKESKRENIGTIMGGLVEEVIYRKPNDKRDYYAYIVRDRPEIDSFTEKSIISKSILSNGTIFNLFKEALKQTQQLIKGYNNIRRMAEDAVPEKEKPYPNRIGMLLNEGWNLSDIAKTFSKDKDGYEWFKADLEEYLKSPEPSRPAGDAGHISLQVDENTKAVKGFAEKILGIFSPKLDNRIKSLVQNDINLINDKLNTPSYLASKHANFRPLFEDARQITEDRDQSVADLHQYEMPRYKLHEKSKAKVDKVLEQGRLNREVYSTETLKQKGLNEAEIKAYWGIRNKYTKALKMIEDFYVDVLGGDREVISEELSKLTGYVPFSRFGEWAVTVKGKNDAATKALIKMGLAEEGVNETIFQMYENKNDAIRAANKLIAAHPDASISLTRIAKMQKGSMFEGMDVGTFSLLAKLADIDPAISDPFIREAQEFFKGRGFSKHFLEAKDTAGYSTDWDRVHADYTVSLANYLSRIKGIRAMKEHIKGIDPQKQPLLFKYADDYTKYMEKPGEEMAGLRSALFLYYLGLNPKSAALNLTQSLTTTIPYLGQYAPFASLKVMSAMKDVMSAIGKDGKIAHQRLGEVGKHLKEAEDKGIVSEQIVYELMGKARGEMLANEKAKVARALTYMFSTAEVFNRRVAFLSAYRIGEQLQKSGKFPKEFASIQEFAEKAVTDTQFEYGRFNRPRIARGKAGATFFCVDEKTEALTTEGWKNIDTLKEGDLIASFNMESETLEWKPVTWVYRADYDGDMISIKDRHIDMMLTPDHKVVTYRRRRVQGKRKEGLTFYNLELQEARNLKGRDKIPTAASFKHIPEGELIPNAIVELIGWIITEGCYYPDGSVRIYQNKGRKADAIRDALKKAGIKKWTERSYRYDRGTADHMVFFINGRNSKMLRSLIPGKTLEPQLLLRMPTEQIRLLVDTMIEGDGHINKKTGDRCFIQNAGVTLDTFQMALTMLGISYSVRKHNQGSLAVLIRKGKNYTLNRAERKTIQYKGRIWCPQVQDTATWVARRNGKPFITHNTFKTFMLQYSELMAKMARNNGENIRPHQFLKAMGIMFILAGAAGLPFWDDLKKAYEALTGDNLDVKARDIANEVFGDPKFGEVFMRGITRLGPYDMSNAIGIGDMIPDVSSISLLGPAGGVAQRVWNSRPYFNRGQFWRGVETMSPEALRNPLAAYRIAQEGQRNKRGQLISDVAERWPKNVNVVGKALGFQPSDLARAYERERAQAMIGGKRAQKKQEYVDRIARASIDGDFKERLRIFQDIKDYNEGKKTQDMIHIKSIDINAAIRRYRAKEDEAGGKYKPKQARREYRRLKELFR